MSYLALACYNANCAPLIPRLMGCGCDPRVGERETLPLIVAAMKSNTAAFAALLKDDRTLEVGQEALVYVSKDEGAMATPETRLLNTTYTRMLLEAGVDPTPLLKACGEGTMELPPARFHLLYVSFALCLFCVVYCHSRYNDHDSYHNETDGDAKGHPPEVPLPVLPDSYWHGVRE